MFAQIYLEQCLELNKHLFNEWLKGTQQQERKKVGEEAEGK